MEKLRLERLFGMGSGYVMDFSNRTFYEFVLDSTGRDIDDQKYNRATGSKANRLRAFWTIEANHVVGKLLHDLLDYCFEFGDEQVSQDQIDRCRPTVTRLRDGAPVAEIDSVTADMGERDVDVLARQVRAAIDNNEPETGLDRLHTFTSKYLRALCERHGISTSKDKPLHSLAGELVKDMKESGRIQTVMTERILKSSLSVLDAFNKVRNDHSFAHDNPLLSYEESLLIFNHITSLLRFISKLEEPVEEEAADSADSNVTSDDLPF